MNRIRTLIVAGAVAGFMSLGTAAMAAGPSGSDEPNDPETGAETNQVQCNNTAETPDGLGAYAGANGVEVCNDGGTGVQGRVIVTSDDGGYAAIDGDADNTQDPALQSYARVDQSGPQCGDAAAGDTDSTEPQGLGTCGP